MEIQITFTNSLTVNYIVDIYNIIKEKLSHNKRVFIKHQNVEEVDLSYIQLMIYFLKLRDREKRDIEFDLNSDILMQKISESGLDRYFLVNMEVS